jgi:endonuclease/exonuclease/phosphatase family metal-dependent hydrolase
VRRGFRVVTANLLNGRADPAAFADLVAGLDADAVAVQELAPPQAAALARVLPHGRLDPRWNHLGMGIALRAPAPVDLVSLPYRPAYVARLGGPGPRPAGEPAAPGPAGGRPPALEILNVHLAAPHVRPLTRALGVRRGQVAGLTAYLAAAPACARVLVGDLNSTPLWPAYRRLTARLADAARVAAAGNGHRPARTWGPWPGAPRLFRIDHALVEGLGVGACRVLPVRGSDHSAVVVDLEPWPPAGAAGAARPA